MINIIQNIRDMYKQHPIKFLMTIAFIYLIIVAIYLLNCSRKSKVIYSADDFPIIKILQQRW